MAGADTKFNDQELAELKKHFQSFDQDGDGSIDAKELAQVLKNLGEYQGLEQLSALILEVDQDGSGTIEFKEFLYIVSQIKSGKKDGKGGFAKVYEKQKELIQVKGAVGTHSFAQEEMSAFAEHLNNCLGPDKDLDYLLPINPEATDLCAKVRDGLILSKFINYAVANTIDERALNKGKGKLSLFQITENQNLCISAAKSIGVQTTNLGASELIDGDKSPHLVLGLVWQLVRIQLLNSINLQKHPELFRLLEPGETLEDLLRLKPDELLLRWFNYHLKNAGHPTRVTNFGSDIKDGIAYTVLLHQIAPTKCDNSALKDNDVSKRADKVIANSKLLGVASFIKGRDIVKGNTRLNLAFCASIFNTCPGLDPLTEEEEKELAGMMDDDFGDSREERAFRMWINSLNLDGVYVNSLFEDCKDGLVLLKVLDFIQPGVVAWSKVEKNPNNKFKKVANCNYAVVLGKEMKFSLVGIAGSDLNDGNRKLTLALVWQMMRSHTIKFLSEAKLNGKQATEDDIVQWANNKVATAGRSTKMSSFKDPSLATSFFFMDLLFAVEKRIINWDLVTPAENADDKLLNARYAISVARKLGCTIFLLPEDIVEVKPKMLLTFVAAIMSVSK